MNAAQTRRYFWEWGQVRACLIGKGVDPKQADAKRHELHRKALGDDKSSKDFTNEDLDKIIAVFRAVHDAGNLDAQLQQIDQPANRRARLVSRCWAATRTFITGNDGAHTNLLCQRYLDGTADRMFGVSFDRLDHGQVGDAQLRKVMGALERTSRVRRQKKEPQPEPTRDYTVRRKVLAEVEHGRLVREDPF